MKQFLLVIGIIIFSYFSVALAAPCADTKACQNAKKMCPPEDCPSSPPGEINNCQANCEKSLCDTSGWASDCSKLNP